MLNSCTLATMSVADRIRIVGRSSAQQIADGLMDMILEGELAR